MSNQDDTIKNNKEEISGSIPPIKSPIVWSFLTVAFLTLIIGFFTLLSVIVDSIQHSRLNYPDAVLISFLLIFGGFTLLGGTIIMKKWSPQPQIDTMDDTSDIKI